MSCFQEDIYLDVLINITAHVKHLNLIVTIVSYAILHLKSICFFIYILHCKCVNIEIFKHMIFKFKQKWHYSQVSFISTVETTSDLQENPWWKPSCFSSDCAVKTVESFFRSVQFKRVTESEDQSPAGFSPRACSHLMVSVWADIHRFYYTYSMWLSELIEPNEAVVTKLLWSEWYWSWFVELAWSGKERASVCSSGWNMKTDQAVNDRLINDTMNTDKAVIEEFITV